MLLAQVDLRHDRVFFQTQLQEFEEWMNIYHLSDLIRIDTLIVQPSYLHLKLKSKFAEGTIDSLVLGWPILQFEYQKLASEKLENKLFNAFVFQMEIPPNAAKISINSHQKRFFDVQIYYKRDKIRIEEQMMGYLSSGAFKVDVNDLKKVYRSQRDTITKKTVAKVRRGISEYLMDYYKTKGTPYLYKAKIDTSRSVYNEFTYDITNISHEILDAGYYEYLRINVKIIQQGRQVEVVYDFQGKYGSGIFRAPRKSQYKNMEVYYPHQLKDYEDNLIQQIANYIKKSY